MQPRPLPHMLARLALLGLVAILVISTSLPALAGGRSSFPQNAPSTPVPGHTVQLPILVGGGLPSFVLQKAWTSTLQNVQQGGFLAGTEYQYHLTGTNNHTWAEQAHIQWTRQDSCGSLTTVFSDTVSLPSGSWEQIVPSITPDCTGIVTSTVELIHRDIVYPLTTHYVVGTNSSIIIDNHQGFDRCNYPSVQEMQTWWDDSPYWVFNLYIGGSAFACRNRPLDAAWVHQVALQGWNYILTWVGPQAPCSVFSNKMSSNASTAYNQGRTEATSAATAAINLGFLGEKEIYYDLEGFSADTTAALDQCRTATKAFMRGWVERLHELGVRAGGYGSSCRSYISDWDTNTPKPDDIWNARWLLPAQYRPSVPLFGDSCLPDSMWPNHQRIRQYAGGHTESWGGVSLVMDSNLLDGHITSLFSLPVSRTLTGPTQVLRLGPALQRTGVVSSTAGWLLADERLLWTADAGQSWLDISPKIAGAYRPLDAAFRSSAQGWLAAQVYDPAGNVSLQIFGRSDRSGWNELARLPLAPEDAAAIESASFDADRDGMIWLALQVQAGSSFSLGRLFASRDGGRTWQERSLPLGEPVHFSDDLHGWVSGGPTGSQVYLTEDGGFTWSPAARAPSPAQAEPALPSGAIASAFADGLNGWAIVQDNACQGDKSAAAAIGQPFTCTQQDRLLSTRDGGASWTEITP